MQLQLCSYKPTPRKLLCTFDNYLCFQGGGVEILAVEPEMVSRGIPIRWIQVSPVFCLQLWISPSFYAFQQNLWFKMKQVCK